MVCRVGSALIDRRTARAAVGLAIAGSLMLTAGLGIWAVSALSHAIPHSAHTAAWLAAIALITAGVCCGVLMIVVLLGSGGRTARPAEPSWADPHLRGPRPPGAVPPGAQIPGPLGPGPRLPEGHPSGPRPASPYPPAGPPPHPPGPGASPRAGSRPDTGRPPGGWPPPGPGALPDAGPPPHVGQPAGAWPGPGPRQAARFEVAHGDEPRLGTWTEPGPRPAAEPDDWVAGDDLPADDEPMLGRWPSAEPGPGPDAGPELPAWPGQPAVAGAASSQWSTADTGPAPADWAEPEDGFPAQAESDADEEPAGYAGPATADQAGFPGQAGPASHDASAGAAGPAVADWAGPEAGFPGQAEPAADDWPGDDAGLRPGAVLGEGEWTVRAPEATAEPGDWTVADPASPAGGQPSLNLWPTPDSAPAVASPAAGLPAEDEDPDDGPVHRVESAFNVWQRPDQDAGPAAAAGVAPAGAVAPGPVVTESVAPESAAPESAAAESVPAESAAAASVTAESAAPAPADQDHDQETAAAPSTRDWVQHAAARLRDADLLPDAGPLAGRGSHSPTHRRPADDEDQLDPITRPPAPRRSGPAPGWNPDSEEDWLRVLRGLRASEDS